MGPGTCSTAEPITYECLVIMPRMYHLSSTRQTRSVLFSVRQCGMQQRPCLLALIAPAYGIATLSLTTRRDSFHSFDATNTQPVYPQPNVGDCYAAISTLLHLDMYEFLESDASASACVCWAFPSPYCFATVLPPLPLLKQIANSQWKTLRWRC